ncbi:MAG: hypothetical protein IPL49_18105 [Saprospirales bacterium]|nr:hypothetical protein [Saprospirales bacterium]
MSTNLKEPLRKGVEYQFSLFLCRSNKYISQSRLDFKATNYTTPAVLRIWAGNGSRPSGQLLYNPRRSTTATGGNTALLLFQMENGKSSDWKPVSVRDTGGPANGNILVDNCSAIVPAGSEVSSRKLPPCLICHRLLRNWLKICPTTQALQPGSAAPCQNRSGFHRCRTLGHGCRTIGRLPGLVVSATEAIERL